METCTHGAGLSSVLKLSYLSCNAVILVNDWPNIHLDGAGKEVFSYIIFVSVANFSFLSTDFII